VRKDDTGETQQGAASGSGMTADHEASASAAGPAVSPAP
jgi:hypothetical protein